MTMRILNAHTMLRILLVFSAQLGMANVAWAESLDWLTQSIDPSRAHHIDTVTSWHARIMFLAWGILLPVGIVLARYFKIWPGQNWPTDLDRREWWHGHIMLQSTGAALAAIGVVLVFFWNDYSGTSSTKNHRFLGWLTMICLVIQVAGALIRGTRGGPYYRAKDGSYRGDHYDMTLRRKVFEYSHKCIGYLALLFAVGAIVQGLWLVNAPYWMWLLIFAWWVLLLVVSFVFQSRGRAIDTYQAIWGPDPKHPGNSQKPIGIGVNRRQF